MMKGFRSPAKASVARSRVFGALSLAATVAVLAYVPAAADESSSAYQGMAVSVIKAERRCFKDLIQVSGVLVPKTEIQVRPDRDGLQIAQVLIEPGDTVGTGQVLARLVQPTGAPPQNVAIKSPVSGVAVGISAVVGAYTSATAGDPLFRIIVDGDLELKGEVLASILPRLQVDQPADIDIMGIGKIQGKVTSVDSAIDAMTQLGTVRIAFTADPRLRAGAYARAQIDAGQNCGITVPLSAVLYGTEGAVVQVVRGDHIETRRVEVGLMSKGIVEIRDGLDDGDTVIAVAGGFLREGDRVRPQPVQAAAAKP